MTNWYLLDQQEQRQGSLQAWNSRHLYHQICCIHSDSTLGIPQSQSWFHHTLELQNSQWHIHICLSMISEKWFSNCFSPLQIWPHKIHKGKSIHTTKYLALSSSFSCDTTLLLGNRNRKISISTLFLLVQFATKL